MVTTNDANEERQIQVRVPAALHQILLCEIAKARGLKASVNGRRRTKVRVLCTAQQGDALLQEGAWPGTDCFDESPLLSPGLVVPKRIPSARIFCRLSLFVERPELFFILEKLVNRWKQKAENGGWLEVFQCQWMTY